MWSAGARSCSERAVAGWEAFEGHTPHRPYVDAVTISLSRLRRAGQSDPRRRQPVARRRDRSVLAPSTTARTRTTGAQWFPADFITESFPGQFRNWFYSMLAMATVLDRDEPFKTIFGYALVFGEDGRPMHKSWGNAIEFDEAAERMGVDVMRWMFSRARPEDNIRFGWHAADEARRELLVLWNVYAFLVTYARLAGWTPGGTVGAAGRGARAARSLDPVAAGRPRGAGRGSPPGLRRGGGDAGDRRGDRRPVDLVPAPLAAAILAVGRRGRPGRGLRDPPRDASSDWPGSCAPILPFLTEAIYDNLVAGADPDAPDSVHLTPWPTAELAGYRDEPLEAAMATARRAVELVANAPRQRRAEAPPAARPAVARPARRRARRARRPARR